MFLRMILPAALADTTDATTSQSNNIFFNMLPMVAIFAIFYIFMILPQQRKAKSFAKMLDELVIGDKVATAGGIIGTIMNIDDAKLSLQIADGVCVTIFKRSITDIVEKISVSKDS